MFFCDIYIYNNIKYISGCTMYNHYNVHIKQLPVSELGAASNSSDN